MENAYPSLSDIAAVTDGRRYNDGFGCGGGDWWIILLFLFAMGGGGFGGWGNGQGLTQAQMQQGFDTQEITRKLDGISYGLADGFYAQNTTMLNGFREVTDAVQQARFDAQHCCCETNRNIDNVRYEGAKNTCDIIQAQHEDTQKILDAITGNRIADMQNQINQLQLREALCGVVRYPNATTYTAGGNPFFRGGCGSGCGS